MEKVTTNKFLFLFLQLANVSNGKQIFAITKTKTKTKKRGKHIKQELREKISGRSMKLDDTSISSFRIFCTSTLHIAHSPNI